MEVINSKNAENINKLNADFDKKMADEKAKFQNEMSKQQASFQQEKDSLNQTNEKERQIYEAKTCGTKGPTRKGNEKRLEKEYNKKVKEIREQEAKKVKAIKLKAKKKMFTAEELENIK